MCNTTRLAVLVPHISAILFRRSVARYCTLPALIRASISSVCGQRSKMRVFYHQNHKNADDALCTRLNDNDNRKQRINSAVDDIIQPKRRHIMKKEAAAFITRLPVRRFSVVPSAALLPSESGNFDNFVDHSSSILASSTPSADVVGDALSTEDIVVGTILAFILAFSYSYLNGQSSSTSFVSWGNQIQKENESLEAETTDDDERVFDANNWKDISREENYVLYNTRVKSSLQKLNTKQQKSNNVNVDKTENKLVLVALLALFVPIFSVEFFFALSRQFLCEVGDPSDRIEFVQKLCSPVL